MNLENALDMYNKMLKQFGQTCADTIDDDETNDDTVDKNLPKNSK